MSEGSGVDLKLDRKVALVAGASRGIGKGIAETLAREGARVVLAARGAGDVEAAAAQIRDGGGEAVAVAADLTSPEGPATMVAAAEAAFGPVEILVSNAGGNRRGAFLDTTDEDWTAILELNLLGHLRLARAVASGMVERRAGSIVFVSSIFGREVGGAGLSLYNTTKSALISAAAVMARELAPRGVRVNSVAPGSIRFPGGSWDRRCIDQPEAMRDFIAANLPLGRFGSVDEVADVVAYLASPRASLVVGACWTVDGGQSHSLI